MISNVTPAIIVAIKYGVTIRNEAIDNADAWWLELMCFWTAVLTMVVMQPLATAEGMIARYIIHGFLNSIAVRVMIIDSIRTSMIENALYFLEIRAIIVAPNADDKDMIA